MKLAENGCGGLFAHWGTPGTRPRCLQPGKVVRYGLRWNTELSCDAFLVQDDITATVPSTPLLLRHQLGQVLVGEQIHLLDSGQVLEEEAAVRRASSASNLMGHTVSPRASDGALREGKLRKQGGVHSFPVL